MNKTFILQNIPWIVLAIVSGGMLLWPIIRGNGGRSGISPSQAVMLINRQNAIIVDLREKSAFDTGHIPNARHIPETEIKTRLGDLNKFKSRPIILICQTGARSGTALAEFSKAGFEQAFNLTGGIGAWVQAGHPLITKEKKS